MAAKKADNGKVTRAKLSDIKTDPNNANLHTERGQYMVRRSMERFGFAEAGTLDKNNVLIGGELRTETAADVLEAEEAIILDVDGKTPVYIRRNDLDINEPDTVELAIALNRGPQESINFDPERIGAIIDMGIDLGNWWQDFELEEMGVIEPKAENGDYQDIPEDYSILIQCSDEMNQAETLEQLAEMGYQCRALIS